MEIVPVRALRDNYIWMMRPADDGDPWVVDPGEAAPVFAFLEQAGEAPAGILLTHHHADHAGGIAQILDRFPDTPVYGAENSPVSLLTHRLQDGDAVSDALPGFVALAIPGHTLDHLAYVGQGSVYCGDTLFSAGCGRIFEGAPAMMAASLARIAALPDETRVYCGHEYTAANLRFAVHVEPENKAVAEAIQAIEHARQKGVICTLPSTLAHEKQVNPFLRCTVPSVVAGAARLSGERPEGPVDVFRVLRALKDAF